MKLEKKKAIKYIHVLKSQAGISDENYRTILNARFNKESSKELTEAQASVLIKILKGLVAEDKGTGKQVAKFNILFKRVFGDNKDKKEFIKEQTGRNVSIYSLTKKEYNNLITALQKIEDWQKKDE